MENRDRQYLNMPSMQARPLTLGEILLREEMEDMNTAPRRSMARTMSPTRCLGSVASGRPRRARGRSLTRQSTSTEEFNDEFAEPQSSEQSQDRRQRAGTSGMPNMPRYHRAIAEARLRNFYSIMNGPRPSRRRGASATARPRQRSLERSDSPDLFYNPFSWHRRRGNSMGRRMTRSRSATSAGVRSRSSLRGRSQRTRLSLYDSREEPNTSAYRCRRSGRPHSGRPDPEPRQSTENQTSETESALPASVESLINYSAEFLPVEEQPPDAEPPEWSLNITAADFGPFAVGRTALSRSRALAVMGALSQVVDEPTEAQPNTNGN